MSLKGTERIIIIQRRFFKKAVLVQSWIDRSIRCFVSIAAWHAYYTTIVSLPKSDSSVDARVLSIHPLVLSVAHHKSEVRRWKFDGLIVYLND